MLDPLYDAVAWSIVQLHALLSTIAPADSGWAWAGSIILFTILMRTALFPLFVKQIHMSRKMQDLQPRITALGKKYKNDKQRLSQETLKLYRESGANPLAGCLPLLVQTPLFFALFGVLRGISAPRAAMNGSHGISAKLAAGAQRADIFGAHVTDTFLNAAHRGLSAAVVVTALAVIISSTTTYLSMRAGMKRQPSVDPANPMASAQKMIVFLAPLFGVFGINLPLGVLLYWVTTNSWTLCQTHYINGRYPVATQASVPNQAAPKRPATR